MDKINREVIYYRESAIQSIISDVFTFGGFVGLLLLNYKILNGDWFVTVFFLFLWLTATLGRAKSKRKTFTSMKQLRKYIDDQT